MKRFKSVLLVALLLTNVIKGCTGSSKYKIVGEIQNVETGNVTFVQIKDSKLDTVAVAPIVNGKFELVGEADYPKKVMLRFNKIQGFYMFLEKGKINVNATVNDNRVTHYKVEGSKLFDEIIEPGRQGFLDMANQLTLEITNPKINKKEKQDLIAKATKISLQFIENERNRIVKIYESTNDSWTNLMARDYNTTHMYDGVTKIEDIAALEKELGANAVIDGIKARLPKMIKKFEKSQNVGLGKEFKDFVLKDKDGNLVKLSDHVKKNKLVLLDFWASWCGPCRAEFPHLKRAYEKYHDMGFEIFAVSVDKSEKAWNKALVKENVDWINVIDSDNDINDRYGVTGIPANFLISSDAGGKIIKLNLRGHDLDAMLEKVFGK